MTSRIFRTSASFSSGVPVSTDGSGKLQWTRMLLPGKIGQRSAFVSSQTVIT